MNSELLASISGIVLSLLFAYVPGISQWYDALTGEYKRLIMAGLLLVVSLAIFGLSCAGYLNLVTCDQDGAVGLVRIFVMALVANQSAYLISSASASRAG